MENILEVSNLSKHFKGFSLKNISLKLEKGLIMGFIGPNGAGKSTTIKLILNLMKRDSGDVKLFGLDNQKNEREVKNRIGVVFDESYFYEELTLREMKNIVARAYKNWDDARFGRYLKEFGLPGDKKIKELSKGMKMKYSLALAFSHHAEFLIMDEPTSGLDPLVRSELLEILSNLMQDENKGVFFSTHITSDLDKIADYVTLIHEGEILFSAAKDDVCEKHVLVKGGRELLEQIPKEKFIGLKENKYGFEGLACDRDSLKKYIKDRVIVEKPTLEDIMLFYTRRGCSA